jgi:hypothetical protein
MKTYASMSWIHRSLLKIATFHKNNVILDGDFNAPYVDWINPLNQTTASKKLLEVFNDYDLNQLVTQTTRRQGNRHNILDLVLLNNKLKDIY